MTKTRRIAILPLVAAVAAALLLVFFGVRQFTLRSARSELLAELANREGEYDPQSIVLNNTNRAEAEALAKKLDAKLRMTKDGSFATLTLEDDRTVSDVFSDDTYLSEMSKLSADWSVRIAALDDEEADLAAMRRESRVRRPEYTVSDSYYAAQTYLDYMNLSSVWNKTRGSGVTVAVIDSGIDTDHPEFAGRISEYSYNVSEDKIVKDYNDWSLIEDENGHGTAVAGVIGAAMDGSGTVGIAPDVNLLVIKADLDSNGESFRRSSDLVFALYYAIERDVDVVNMSFGGEADDLAKPLQLAVDSDIICVAAAGNDSSAEPHYPAASPNCIGVGALDSDSWALADYSNYGENVDVVAPGTTLTAAMGGEYRTKNGTSMAAPAVTGAVALYLSQNHNAEYKALREVLLAASYDLGELGPDFYYGYGAVDVSALVLEEKGTVTFDYLTDEIDATTQVFVRSHTLQALPIPERPYAVFDGWYYDPHLTEKLNWYQDRFSEDLTLYAGWTNEDDGIPYTYTELDDGTIEILSYTGHRHSIVIPTYIDGKIVSGIGMRAFALDTSLRQIILPDHLKTIKDAAFQGCTGLTSITLSDSVTSIGKEAFRDAIRLRSVEIGEESRLQSLGDYAFQNCMAIRSILLPAPLTGMNGSAFYGCTRLESFRVSPENADYTVVDGVLYNAARTKVVAYPAGLGGNYQLPDSVDHIGDYAFAYASITQLDLNHTASIGKSAFENAKLTSIDLQGVTSIDENAFKSSNLRALVITESVTAMGKGVFAENKSLASLSIGNGLVTVPKETFSGCVRLESVTIPQGVHRIEEDAFSKSGLRFVFFEENSSLTSIEKKAFMGTSLDEITLPDSLSSIGDYSFSGIARLSAVHFGIDSSLRSIGDYAFSATYSLKSIDLPDDLERIGESAFMNGGLTEITVPRGVTTLGRAAFAECCDLDEINVAAENTAYKSVGGAVFTKDGKELVAYPCGAPDSSYVIPGGVETVNHAAFYGARSLTAVVLPESLREIGIQSFYDCTSLTSITIPNSVEAIGRLAFGEDWRLSNITFSNSSESNLTSIGSLAFANCGISFFSVPSNVSRIAQYAFSGCSKLISVVFEENSRLESIPAYCFEGCGSLNKITFKNGARLRVIQAHAFDGLKMLSSVDFGNAPLTSIGNYAFYSCAGLRTFTVPEGVTSLGRYVFAQCTSLNDVSLPASLDSIGSFAFMGSKNSQVYFAADKLPTTLREYWNYGISGYYVGVRKITTTKDWKYATFASGDIAIVAYLGTETAIDLNAVSLGGNITNIGGKAFADSGVEEVILPDTVTVIQNEAFFNSKLRSVDIPAAVTFVGNSAFAHTPIQTLTFVENAQIRTIEYSAFEDTKELEGVVIPESVTTLGTAVFKWSGIQSLAFENGSHLTEIPKEAFAYSDIRSLSIPNSVSVIRDSAFRETRKLENVSFGTHPDLMIRANAFYLSGLSSLYIPENVTYIGECAFAALQNLEEYRVAAENAYYQSVDGCLVSKDGRRLIAAPAGKTGDLTVPSGIETISISAFEGSHLSSVSFRPDANILALGCRAFFGMDHLTSITIPASVVSVEYYAFAYCENLRNVVFENGSKILGIYEGVFCGDSKLSDIILPATVTEISDFAFYACNNLTEFPCENSDAVQRIGQYAMAYSGLTGELTTPANLYEIGQYAFMGTRITHVTVPNARQYELEIGVGAFQDCNQMREISVPFIGGYLDDLEHPWFSYIFGERRSGKYTDYIPQSLKTVTISGNQSVVGFYALSSIKTIDTVNLPDTINQVYPGAFYNSTFSYELHSAISVLQETGAAPAFTDSGLCGEIKLADGIGTVYRRLFQNAENLTSVILPEGIRTIDTEAFRGCASLSNISLPSTLETINSSAFSGCNELVKITNNSNLELTFGAANYGNIAKYALMVTDKNGQLHYKDGIIEDENGFLYDVQNGTYRLVAYIGDQETVTLPAQINGANYQIYHMCGVRNVVIPGSVLVGDEAFMDCDSLLNVRLLSGITSIGDRAFCLCRSLTQIQLPDGLINIGSLAFQSTSIRDIYIPDSVTSIGNNAFSKCVYLERIALPNGLKTISGVFMDCTSLESVVLPNELTEIGSWTFSGCTSLSSLTIPEHLTVIGGLAFSNCRSLKEFTVPESVEIIGVQAFQNCTSLTYLTIPNKVSNVYRLFEGCDALTVTIASDHPYLAEQDGVLYDREFTKILDVLPNAVNITIPESVTAIPKEAFLDHNNLMSVTLPSGLTAIGEGAFKNCGNLAEIVIPEQVTSIGTSAFAGCKNLEKVTIRCEIDTIPDSTFSHCPSLSEVKLPDSLTRIERCAFYWSGIESIEFPDGLKEIGQSAFAQCTYLERLDLPDGLETIRENAFSSCTSLGSVHLPKSLKTIAQTAFSSCLSISEIKNDSNFQLSFGSTENGAVATRASKITEADGTVRFNEGCNETEDGFLYKMSQNGQRCVVIAYLGDSEAISIPRKINGVDCEILMRYAGAAKKIIVPEGVEKIGDFTFCYCNGVTSIELPDSVTFIGSNAIPAKILGDSKNWEDGYLYIGKHLVGVDENIAYMSVKPDTRSVAYNLHSPNTKYSCSFVVSWAGTQLETMEIWSDFEPGYLNGVNGVAKNIVMRHAGIPRNRAAFYFLSNVTIWVDRPEYECNWDELMPGWNNGNPVVYGGDWSFSTFYDVDGTIIYKTPRRNSGVILRPNYSLNDAQYDYTIGWDLNGDGVADTMPATSPDDIVARAVITKKTLRNYSVTFLDYDGTVLSRQSCAYGTIPTAPEDPVRIPQNPNRYSYEFAGWDREIAAVTGDVTYTATYTRTQLMEHIPGDVNWDGHVNNVDAILLFRYLSDLPADVDETVADMNGDGMVNNMDAITLFRYLSGVDVVLH